MKKLLIFVCMIGLIILSSCSEGKTFDVKNQEGETVKITAKPYGIFNGSDKIVGVQYKVCPEDIVMSIIFSETLIIPIYCIGWDLWEPVSLTNTANKIQNGVIIE